jgi:membrane-associated phospholipid phosphatase
MFLRRIDHHVHAWIKARRSAETERVVRGFSQVGSSAVVLPLTATAATTLVLLGKRNDGARLIISASLAALTGFLLQHAFHRERPSEGRYETSSSSFPSTHTLTATAAYSTLGAILLRSEHASERAAGVLAFGLLVPFVPASRVILGMHWVSDVVGSVVIGGSIAVTVCAFLPRLIVKPSATKDGISVRTISGEEWWRASLATQ